MIRCWLAVDKDGTEKIFQSIPYNIRCLGNSAITTLETLFWLFRSHNLSEDENKNQN